MKKTGILRASLIIMAVFLACKAYAIQPLEYVALRGAALPGVKTENYGTIPAAEFGNTVNILFAIQPIKKPDPKDILRFLISDKEVLHSP